MIVSGFGIMLTRLTHDDIELVRLHRNSETIRRRMEYREEITPEMQENWFSSIDNDRNNYFIIRFREKACGLIYGADIDWENKLTGNGGIFIWEEELYETPVPLSSSLLLTDMSFILGFERTYIKVLRDNLNAIGFNRNLGYELLPGQENVMNQRYVLTRENYERKAARFRNALIRQYGQVFRVTITDPSHPASKKFTEALSVLPEENRARIELVIA